MCSSDLNGYIPPDQVPPGADNQMSDTDTGDSMDGGDSSGDFGGGFGGGLDGGIGDIGF